jgi:hypothetical protein
MYKKNLLFLLTICLFSFISCKKQYACQCSTTYQKPGQYSYTVSSLQNIDSKTTKKRAQQICAHAEKQLDQNSQDYKAPSETLRTSCAVK